MDTTIGSLLECLSLDVASDAEVERCGFLLSMVIEKHSAQRSPSPFYQEVLPKPYIDIVLEASDYRRLVSEICTILNLPQTRTRSQDMLLFAIGGTDTTTLDLTIPALVHFLQNAMGESNFGEVIKCLRRMLSSPQALREQASKILPKLQGVQEIRRLLSKKDVDSREQAIAALDDLQRLLQS